MLILQFHCGVQAYFELVLLYEIQVLILKLFLLKRSRGSRDQLASVERGIPFLIFSRLMLLGAVGIVELGEKQNREKEKRE